jgi:hypothetical protein
MDAVKRMSMVEHIRKRVGMYWQTHDGIPDASVWIFFLDQLANEMGSAFMRGEASYVDIRYDNESKAMSIECDGSAVTDDLCGVCKGEVLSLLGGDRDLGGVDYAMITALSRRMEIVTCRNSEWSAVQCVDGHVGGIERMFPEIMGTANRVRVSFTPSEQFYKIDEKFDRFWPDEVLKGLGSGLAARCPGLAVSVNSHRYVYKNGVQGLVEELLKPLGGGTLMRPRSATYKNASLACGAVRRDDSIRRVFGKFYLNGREVKNQYVMGRIMEIAVNQLIDNCRHASSGYDFVFVVNGYCPDMYFNNERIYAYDHETWYQIHDHAYHDLGELNPQIAKCMLMAFKEYMK